MPVEEIEHASAWVTVHVLGNRGCDRRPCSCVVGREGGSGDPEMQGGMRLRDGDGDWDVSFIFSFRWRYERSEIVNLLELGEGFSWSA